MLTAYRLRLTAYGLPLSAALFYAAFRKGGVYPSDWYVASAAVSLIALATLTRVGAPAPSGWLLWPLLLLPAYAAIQLLPLPVWLLYVVSPERARQLEHAGLSTGSIAVSEANALYYTLVFAACVLTVMLVRELAWPGGFALAAPLVLLASLQAALGLMQPSPAHGTYVNRNHFAGLLEMTLPFPVMYAAAVLRRHGPALAACAALSAAALILAGVVRSHSRMGFTAAILALAVCAAASRLTVYGLLLAALLFVYLPPDQLIAHFGDLSQDRVLMWRESLHVVAAYPLFGCGLGGFESAFCKFKSVAPMLRVDFAHNDYLQCAAELGVFGFLLTALLLAAILAHAIRALANRRAPELAAACLASFAAILLHSAVDFNMYIPANALALAWISGIAASLD